ncbi:hypothetical protein F2Q70_00025699 [Brassica cretica]|uniref:Uncharacterized protein n=2 Tax=Brassica cretica TaxID=69181 RepID=A0A8S9IAT9_BRACR|nr:hypothetical protein F2Q68_00025100 [Brassica cretica]KAF2603065.1 hypothetical protein F2Q70_00025699 [Brassica cretica]KAF3578214.1 hypothetical protein DY000_02030551 [Brassica cretica]
MPEGPKSDEWTEKLKMSQCMSLGRSVYHLTSLVSTEPRGVAVYGSCTCSLTCRSMRCPHTCNRSMLIDM